MPFLYAPLVSTCEFQFFLLLSFSLQIYAMFDNVSTEINFLVLEAISSPLNP